MDIRLMNEREYELSKGLWMECFPGDGKGFVDWYYAERTRPEYALGAFLSGEAPAAMLHMLPMKMRFDGRDAPICFVAGVSTRPDMRRRGICAELFERAFDIMRERGFEASVLQPFRTDFYERFGYKTHIIRQRIELSYERPNAVGRSYEEVKPDPSRLKGLYEGYMRRFGGWSIRDEGYFTGFIREYSMAGAELVVTGHGCCAGYADEDDPASFTATELFFEEGTDPAKLLPKGYSRYAFPLPMDAMPPEGCLAGVEEFSMIKPLTADFDMGTAPLFGFDRY